MGDIADWTNDCMQEAYPDWMPVGDPYRSRRRTPAPTRCRGCRSRDVRWRQQGGRWVLFSLQSGVEHACPVAPLGAIEDPDA